MNHEENISGLENDSKHSYLLENFIDNFHSFDKNKKKKRKTQALVSKAEFISEATC